MGSISSDILGTAYFGQSHLLERLPRMKTVNQLFETASQQLQTLFQKSQQIAHLNQCIRPLIPPDLREHCVIANYEASRLKLLVNNASMATAARFAIPQILKQLHTKPEWRFIQSIVIAIPRNPLQDNPENIRETSQPRFAQEIPTEAVGGFEWLAEQETDPALKAVLLRLSRKPR